MNPGGENMLSAAKKYVSITKKQWNGLVVLFVLTLLFIIYKLDARNAIVSEYTSAQAITAAVRHLSGGEGKPLKIEPFDPNVASKRKMLQLGLSERQVNNVINYRDKGGHFYTKADMLKLYTIDSVVYQRLAKFITLPEAKAAAVTAVDLNTADSAQLLAVKGIGPVFAGRIIKYRKLLGGFYHKKQLLEVYGISADAYTNIESQVRVGTNGIKRINVNQADATALNRLPYLSYKQANAIEQYRLQHGDYSSFADLSDIAILDAATINKIKPYITFK